jgi:hypothetical protein
MSSASILIVAEFRIKGELESSFEEWNECFGIHVLRQGSACAASFANEWRGT